MMTTDLSSLKQAMCVDMVVGPNVEAISDSPVIQQQAQTCITNDKTYFGLPYQDHNYGAPLPVSPLSVFVKRGLNNGVTLNDSIATSNKMCMKQNLTISALRKNGEIKATYSLKNSIHKKEYLPSDSIHVGDVTRCICGYTHDDGYMIMCDKCKVWQHIDCMNIDRNSIPDAYLCDLCNPRELNKVEAMQLQEKKLQDFSIVSEISSGGESGDEREPTRVTYTAVQSTPTSLTITSNRTTKRSDSLGTGKKRKRSKDENKRTTKKAYTMERKRSRSISKGTLNDDEQMGAFLWTRKLKEWNESYREIDENLYTAELLQAVLSSSCFRNNPTKANDVLTQLRTQLAKVQQLRNKVLAMEDICVSQPIIEVIGSYMLSNQTEVAKSGVFKRPYPHMFFYNGFDGLEVVVDSRVDGNIARYLRRSCCPNAEVKHVVAGNQLHLLVYSKDNISNGSEITIPFDFKYQNCLYDVVCACERYDACPVHKFTNMRNHNLNSTSKSKDSDSGRVSPLRLSISRIHDHQINGYPSSDHESQINNDTDQANNQPESQRKKSREDRKMEAYMRIFARLEKKEKRKEQLHLSLSSPIEAKSAVKDNSTVTSGSNNLSKTSLSNTLPTDDSISATSQPARRTNRRRSTKGGRRSGKKTRMPSYEGVLSPSLSVENDSNHSLDVTPTTPDIHSMNSITEESSQKGIIESRSESIAACDVEMGLSSSETDPISCQSESIGTTTSQTTPSSRTTSTYSSNTSTVDYTVTSTKGDILNPIESGLIPVESIDDLPPLTIECVSQEPPVVVSSSSGTKVAKKKTTTTDALSGTNKPSESTNFTIPSLPIITSFTNWEFTPGVPKGQVRIGVGILPKKKHPKETHIKKGWLNSAKEEGLIPENSPDLDTETPSLAFQFGVKKRFLKTYLNSSDETTSTSQDITDTDSATTESETNVATIEQGVPPPSDNMTASTLNFSPASSSLLTSSAEHCIPLHRNYPAIEYESLSEDEQDSSNLRSSVDTHPAVTDGETGAGNENKIHCQEVSYFSPQLNGDVNLSTPLPPRTFDRDLPPKQPNNLEDSQASAKKKVSLQEYWKRNKEQRKSLNTEQSETKLPITTSACSSSTINTTSSPTLPTIQTPTSTTPAVSTTSQPSSHTSFQATTPSRVIDTSSPATTPTSIAEQVVETKEQHENVEENNKEKEETTNQQLKKENCATKPGNKIAAPKIDDLSSIGRNMLVDLLSRSEMPLSKDVKEFLKNITSTGSSSPNEKSVSASKSLESKKINRIDKGLSRKSVSTDRKEESTKGKGTPTPVRPSVERCNSSPSVRQFQQPRQGGTPSNSARKIGGSQHSSPSSRQSTPSSCGPRKGFTSPPQGASPRLIRGHSGSSISSHSPTPTLYDRRRRSEYSSRDSTGSAKSRHSSGASGDSANNKSPKSTSSGESTRPLLKHSVSGSEHKSRPQDSPQKVPSITPDVPGQPIPSLARGPGTNRVPEVVYNRLSSPPSRVENNFQPWDMHSHDPPPPSRSLKDIPYDRQHPYYYPTRLPSPPPGSVPPDRSSRDKYYDRYDVPPSGPRVTRREDEHHSGYYHHHHPPYYPPDYRGDRPSYYSPRETRPPSPIPPPRSNSDYYHRSSGYYPVQDFRR